ncbi:hypothetical protein HgNV_090 [Homarus gammarus nudivirus]|uniref:Uncharacterized protein n=1 Tax=Homarus gammarus nudivirus TaxID=2509616 RepID=A0A411HBA4_9VIRU|nr:hypothetical protein KM727_gp90 [Homarus gammarus nudivirus]QBB28695.1 hypothetical protein HgNV_090 [Homarus gammarus nudivirus]
MSLIVVLNCNLCSKINKNTKIDYVSIYPHTIIFATKITYKLNNETVTIIPNDNNTVNITKLDNDDVPLLFSRIMKMDKGVLFVRFDDREIKSPDMSQILENLTKLLHNKYIIEL